MEVLGVFAGFLTGVIVDGFYISPSYWNNYYYYISVTLLIGMPTALGSLLAFGLPR
jgi:hypothetical protein